MDWSPGGLEESMAALETGRGVLGGAQFLWNPCRERSATLATEEVGEGGCAVSLGRERDALEEHNIITPT